MLKIENPGLRGGFGAHSSRPEPLRSTGLETTQSGHLLVPHELLDWILRDSSLYIVDRLNLCHES